MFHRALFAALFLLAAPLGGASGQINLKKLKEAIKRPADSTARPPESAAKRPDSTAQKRPDSTAKQASKVWENYDFVPGSKIIFYTEFSEDRVGNFARGLKYKSGPGEVVERDGIKVLRAVGRTEFLIPVGKKSLTDGYTRANLALAKSLLVLQRPAEAIAVLRPAIHGVDGSNTYVSRTELHEVLAQAFEQAGQRDSAAAHWRAVESAWRHADQEFRERYLTAKRKARL
jgi:hypothetical protein